MENAENAASRCKGGANSYPAANSPERIAAAFSDFHRKIEARLFPTRNIGSANGALLLLTLLGFGGGLMLAFFSFNTAERPAKFAALPAETFYLPPSLPFAGTEFSAPLQTGRGGDAAPLVAAGHPQQNPESSEPSAPIQAESQNDGLPAQEPFDLEATANFSAAMRLVAAGHGSAVDGKSDPFQSGYEAIQVSTIPEPSTGLVLAGGISALLGITHLRRRRAAVGDSR